MRLFHKLFLCIVVIFSITFQTAGYFLINFAYENAMEQEKKIALRDFQHNQYILQSILYSDPEFYQTLEDPWDKDFLSNFTVPVEIYSLNGSSTIYAFGIDMLECFVDISKDIDGWMTLEVKESGGGRIFFEYTLRKGKTEEDTAFQIYEKGGKYYIFVCGVVEQGNRKMCLVTQTHISAAVGEQKKMITYFQRLYIMILCISFPVIFLLTKALVAPLKKVGEAAGRIAEGNYSQRISAKGKDEISDLASDFNQMAEQVEEKITQLSDMARQKEDFTANFAHELKTPMTSVIGYADMLYQRDLPREEVKSAAGYILDEGMRLEALSLKLMDLFVMDRQEFLLEMMSVEEMFENLEQGIVPICQKYGVTPHMEIRKGSICADFDLFKTMILNLVDNAVKAGGKDLWISGKRERDSYRIVIRDNGRGIPKAELGRITEAFYMVDKSRSRKQHGAGLGMALVAKIVQIHGARLEIESDGKTGTAVCVAFGLQEGGRDA